MSNTFDFVHDFAHDFAHGPVFAMPSNNTCAYGFGQTRHARQWPVANTFAAGTVFVRLPMRTLAAQAPQRLGGLFGVNRRSLIGFRDRDHGLRSARHGSALAWLDSVLQANNIDDAHGEAWLHTFPAVLGYAFKPVSFWFCHSASGAVRAVLAEVHNTFGEQHCYLLSHADGSALVNGERVAATKVFHVSPFFPVRGEYHFRWLLKPRQSVVRIDYHDAAHHAAQPETVTLSTSISGQHVQITLRSNLQALWLYPLQSLVVVLKIHWQALRLWLKSVPFFTKPAPPAQPISRSL